jgi:hypothetical protein
MTAVLPFGRRRLVLRLSAEPLRPNGPEVGAAVGATDAELARLNRRRREIEQARWDVWSTLHGSPR